MPSISAFRQLVLLALLLLVVPKLNASGPQNPKKSAPVPSTETLHEGDILFQVNQGGQSQAIALATGSKWTHVGILLRDKGKWVVYEAVGPVKATPLDVWATHGMDGHYTAMRWKEAETQLDADRIEKLRTSLKNYMGLPYDWDFRWSDEMIYCSELIWKVYKEGLGIALCEPIPMREYALESETVKQVLEMRYGKEPPLDELMFAPGTLFDCPLLVQVGEF